jgi:hypothetical protein
MRASLKCDTVGRAAPERPFCRASEGHRLRLMFRTQSPAHIRTPTDTQVFGLASAFAISGGRSKEESVLPGTAHRALECDKHALDASGAEPAFDFDGSDAPQLPSLLTVLV